MRRLLLLLCICVFAGVAQTIGEPLNPRRGGELEIHHIQTGRGDSALLIFPDGTSLLVDAGDGPPQEPWRTTPEAPDDSRPAGEWVARYARRALGAGKIDYALFTHFHGDHVYGFADLIRNIEIGTVLDRGWPEYDVVLEPRPESREKYVDVLRRGVQEGKLIAERFQPGRKDQLRLLHRPAEYPNFEVRNLAANGEVWTGERERAQSVFPALKTISKEDWPHENLLSTAIRVRYGAFDYYTGGDLEGVPDPGFPAWQNVEAPVAAAAGPVDVAALNHHGYRDSTTEAFVRALQARLWIAQVWHVSHPGWSVLDRLHGERLYPGPRDVLVTAVMPANRMMIGPLVERHLSSAGHIVIRVAPGGESFRAIILDETSEAAPVKAIHGPFASR